MEIFHQCNNCEISHITLQVFNEIIEMHPNLKLTSILSEVFMPSTCLINFIFKHCHVFF